MKKINYRFLAQHQLKMGPIEWINCLGQIAKLIIGPSGLFYIFERLTEHYLGLSLKITNGNYDLGVCFKLERFLKVLETEEL